VKSKSPLRDVKRNYFIDSSLIDNLRNIPLISVGDLANLEEFEIKSSEIAHHASTAQSYFTTQHKTEVSLRFVLVSTPPV
jgi:hypothetical protein